MKTVQPLVNKINVEGLNAIIGNMIIIYILNKDIYLFTILDFFKYNYKTMGVLEHSCCCFRPKKGVN